MRLLFDEQLSEALVELVRNVFPESLHIRELGAGGATDSIVWQLAREQGCLLVTKDEDFHRLSTILRLSSLPIRRKQHSSRSGRRGRPIKALQP